MRSGSLELGTTLGRDRSQMHKSIPKISQLWGGVVLYNLAKKSVWLGSRWLFSVTPNFLLVFMFCSHSFLFDVLSQFLFAAISLLFVQLIWSSPYSSEEDHVNLLWAKFGPLLFFTPIHQLCNKKMFTSCLKVLSHNKV